jgi:hypothetical protein
MSQPIKFCFVLDRGKIQTDLQWQCESWKSFSLPKIFTINYPRKREIQKRLKSETIMDSNHWRQNEKYDQGWGPAPLEKIFEPGDSEKKTLSGGKLTIRMQQRSRNTRPKTPPILKSNHGSGISFKSSTVVTKQSIISGFSKNRRQIRKQRSKNQIQSPMKREKSSFELSINTTRDNITKEKTKQEKLMNMVQKIIVKIDEESGDSLTGKFKFRNRELGNCFVVLSDDKEKLLGVFTEEDYNERLAYNFLEEIEILIISNQK